MKFDRLWPATETLWVVSYGGKTIPRWQTAAILKVDISPYLSKKIIQFSWNFVHSSRFWTGWTSRDQKWKSCIGQTPEFDRTYFLLSVLLHYQRAGFVTAGLFKFSVAVIDKIKLHFLSLNILNLHKISFTHLPSIRQKFPFTVWETVFVN